jgi:hypothetical protein
MKSRPKRWRSACKRALKALNELYDLQGEYEKWQEHFPQTRYKAFTRQEEKLEAVTEVDVWDIIDAVEYCLNLDLPKGYGRDEA